MDEFQEDLPPPDKPLIFRELAFLGFLHAEDVTAKQIAEGVYVAIELEPEIGMPFVIKSKA